MKKEVTYLKNEIEILKRLQRKNSISGGRARYGREGTVKGE
jgi:hypothetical protein